MEPKQKALELLIELNAKWVELMNLLLEKINNGGL